ncbi:ABC transporter substrate-binding protein [Actinokineospora diospyrosa]
MAVVVLVIAGVGFVFRPESVALERGRILVMTGFGESSNDPRSILFKQWDSLHPENPIETVYVPGEPDQQYARMVNDARPGGRHDADVYVLDVVWMAQFAKARYISELDEALATGGEADFMPKVMETCRVDNKLWALPFNTDAGLFFYRSDIPGVGPPRTWDDYFGPSAKQTLATARKSTPTVVAANAAQLANEEMLTVTALEAMWAAGGQAVAPNGEVSLNAEETEVAFSREDLRAIEKLAVAASDPDLVLTEGEEAKDSTETGATKAFREGRTLYLRNWPVARDDIGDQVEFGVAAPPTSSALGGQNLAISANSDKPRAAQALIQFLTSKSSQLILSEVGGFAPTRNFAYEHARRPDRNELRKAVEGARVRPVLTNYSEFSRVFRAGILRALNDKGRLEPGFAKELAVVVKKGAQPIS